MELTNELVRGLEPYPESVQQLALSVRSWLTQLIPESNELVYDNYNALALAYSKSTKLSDAFCHLALYSSHVNLGFNRGAELTPTAVPLVGKGKLIRHLTVRDMSTFQSDAVKPIVLEALSISEQRNPGLLELRAPGSSRLMSRSENRRRPKPG